MTAQPDQLTPLHPIIKYEADQRFDDLIDKKITPWIFIDTGKPFSTTRFDGRKISYEGIRFEGSVKEVFWNGFIEPFLKNISVEMINSTLLLSKSKNVDSIQALEDARTILNAGILKVFQRMTTIDKRNPNDKIEGMHDFLDERINAEISMVSGQPSRPKQPNESAVSKYPERKHQVFISSTYEDLIEEREEVIRSVLHMGNFPAGMEFFGARSEETLEIINRLLDNCDFYVLIIKDRYGSVTKEGISFTQTMGGTAVQAGSRVFNKRGDRREEERWIAAVNELLETELVDKIGYKGEVFKVNHNGYKFSDEHLSSDAPNIQFISKTNLGDYIQFDYANEPDIQSIKVSGTAWATFLPGMSITNPLAQNDVGTALYEYYSEKGLKSKSDNPDLITHPVDKRLIELIKRRLME